MIKNWIENNLISNKKLVSKRCKKEWFIKNKHIDVYNKILLETNFLNDSTFPQKIWHIVNEKFSLYNCNNPNCNNVPNFLTYTNGYSRTCSNVCAQFDPQTINKIKQTNYKKYGVEYGLSNKDIIEKRKFTCVKNHGVDNPTKSKIILDKIASSNKEKYGVEWILQDQSKKELGMVKKYGVKNAQHSEDIKLRTSTTRRSIFYDTLFSTDRLKNKVVPLFTKEEYIIDGYYSNFKFICLTCNTEFFDCLEDGDVPRCTNCYKHSSIFEEEVYIFIQSLVVSDIIRNDKTILNTLELDVYIPKLKLAFECNGLYWHGEINGGKNKKYHINKTSECKNKGIRLIHIFEDEWLFKKEIVKSRIKDLLTKTENKIFARKCIVKSISSKESNLFLESNHLQGKDNSSIKYGLYFNNELVSLMTFGKLRSALGNKNIQIDCWELYRFCSKLNTTITGGASKLLNYFVNNHNPQKIISYADKRWSVGNLYESIGFKLISDGVPNYWYYGRGNSYKRYHRYGFAKHTLHTKLNNYDDKLSEWENMKNNGYDRIWDCGSIKFELILN
jgi:hypothetical protein